MNDNVRSIRSLSLKDREFEELLRAAWSRAASPPFPKQSSREDEQARKSASLDASAEPPEANGFNPAAVLPFGLAIEHVHRAMTDFIDFLRFINGELTSQRIAQFEDLLTTSNFSSIVSEFLSVTIPKHCPTLAKNNYHNGHPNILPVDTHPNNSIKEGRADGIDIRASRYLENWRRHSGEDSWLMMFVFQSGRLDPKVTQQLGFKFLIVAGGPLEKYEPTSDSFATSHTATSHAATGHAATGRHVITKGAAQKLMANWIYKCKELR